MSPSPASRRTRYLQRGSRRLVVVSYSGATALDPRGVRVKSLLPELRCDWNVTVISGPAGGKNSPALREGPPSRSRSLAAVVINALLLDKLEVWSKQRFRLWRPGADAALLVGAPFSPLAEASRRLIADRIPYIVDIGDPWALTALYPAVRSLALVRARRAETRMWSGAAGAITTTTLQAESLHSLFPNIPILVRPNGFNSADATVLRQSTHHLSTADSSSGGVLRLAHFGNLYTPRLDLRCFLRHLAASRLWTGIEFHQFGFDSSSALANLPSGISALFHEPRPWREIVSLSKRFDAALVVGNRDPAQLPSKAANYLVLPIPRIALARDGDSATARYVKDKPGWITVDPSDPSASSTIHHHVTSGWTSAELAPPPSESWDDVSSEIAAFVLRVLGNRSAAHG